MLQIPPPQQRHCHPDTDVDGYFGPLHAMLDVATRHGFITAVHRDLVITDDDPARLLDLLSAWTPVTTDKWLDKSER